MASKDLYNNIKVVRAISPDTYKNGEGPTGQTIDTQGYESVTLVFTAGAITDAQTLTVKHSFDDSTYNDIEAADVIADPDNTAAAILAAFKGTGTTDNVIKCLGYKGGRQYLKVDSGGSGSTGADYGVVAILGNPNEMPVDRS